MKFFQERYTSPMNIFHKKYPEFIDSISDTGHTTIDKITRCGQLLLSNMANLDDMALLRVETWLMNFCEHENEEISDEIQHLAWHIQEEAKMAMKKTYEIYDELSPKIQSKGTLKFNYDLFNETKYKKTFYIGFEEDDEEDNQIAIMLWTYRKHVQFNHFIYMLYMYDITLKLQCIKRDLIKYDMARYGKQSGSPLDIIIEGLQLQYKEIDEEFKKYNKKITDINYYCYHDKMMYPNGTDLICDYDGVNNQ